MKVLLKLLKWFFLFVAFLSGIVFVLMLFDTDYANYNVSTEELRKPQKKFEISDNSAEYNQLMAAFGKNKELPKGFEKQALLALSFYPQLKEVPIQFLVQEAFIPLSSRPDPCHLLTPWRKRKYLVVISNKSLAVLEPILLKNLPFNEQVGVLGHELAHTVYYLNKSALNLTSIAFRYPFSSFRNKFERDTDKRAIAYGLGYQLHDYAYFVRKVLKDADKLGKSMQFPEESYLSPKEILKEMKRHPMYE